MKYQVVDRDGIVLGEMMLAQGVTLPQVGRAFVSGRPLSIQEAPKAKGKAAKTDGKSDDKSPAGGPSKTDGGGGGGGDKTDGKGGATK